VHGGTGTRTGPILPRVGEIISNIFSVDAKDELSLMTVWVKKRRFRRLPGTSALPR
jgi:hypothetical protein